MTSWGGGGINLKQRSSVVLNYLAGDTDVPTGRMSCFSQETKECLNP